MKKRLHMVVSQDNLKKITARALQSNHLCEPHTGACIEIYEPWEERFDKRWEDQYLGTNFPFRVPYHVVMRSNIKLHCCGGTCFHGCVTPRASPVGKPQRPEKQRGCEGHGSGSGYAEAVCDLHTLFPIARNAVALLGDTNYVKSLGADRDALGLTTADVTEQLSEIDKLQAFDAAGVFAGTDKDPEHYFLVDAFLHLVARLHDIENGNSALGKIARDFPQQSNGGR